MRILVLLAALSLHASAAETKDGAVKKGFGSSMGLKGFSASPRCPRGSLPVSGDSLQPYRCVRAPGEGSYIRHSIPHEMSFEYPKVFRVQDAWKEEVPTVYLTLDDGSPGKPVTITATKYAHNQPTYQRLDSAITRDIEWQHAQDAGVLDVAGIVSRVTSVPRDTRSVYVPLSADEYYSFVLSAPAETFDAYLPTFQHLLKSLSLMRERP